MTDPEVTDETVVEPLLDPATGQPIAPTATYTFAEWCALDVPLDEADRAAFAEFYGAMQAKKIEAREAAEAVEDARGGSAFALYYGAQAEQKMDRGTLDARIKAMKDALAAALEPPPPPPPEDPPTDTYKSRSGE